MKVLFRTDCDNRQGLGHVMRCIALAQSFVAKGVQVAFACSKQDGVIHVKSVGFDAIDLCSLSDRDQIAAISSQFRSDTLSLIIADSYEFSASYLEALNNIAPTAYIDDLHTPELNISAIVNGNITADSSFYSKRYEHIHDLERARGALVREEHRADVSDPVYLEWMKMVNELCF